MDFGQIQLTIFTRGLSISKFHIQVQYMGHSYGKLLKLNKDILLLELCCGEGVFGPPWGGYPMPMLSVTVLIKNYLMSVINEALSTLQCAWRPKLNTDTWHLRTENLKTFLIIIKCTLL